jgi:serine/threonine protein kinase
MGGSVAHARPGDCYDDAQGMEIDVGQVVAKKYELVRLLGRGSMGEVWAAHHQALGEQVALKVLTWPRKDAVAKDDAEEPSVALARFRFEAQVAARLSRKTRHIARVTDYGEDDGLPYLVMELLDGEALDAVLRQRGPLPLAETARIVSQIARALSQAHAESVAHRDLKPANVFLTHDEEGNLLVKLLDFGIARTIHAHRMQGPFSTAKGFVFGTPGYMSPEQTRASPKLDHRCDLWALATIAYEMLTCELPVDGADADELMTNLCAGRIVPIAKRNSSLPEGLGPFFQRAFAERVDDRFEGAASLAQQFVLACGATPSSSQALADLSSPDTSTAIEFSTSVARESLPLHRRTGTRIAMLSAAALVAVIAALGGPWRGAAAPPDVNASLPAPIPAPSGSVTVAPPPGWQPIAEPGPSSSRASSAPAASSPTRVVSAPPAGPLRAAERPKAVVAPLPPQATAVEPKPSHPAHETSHDRPAPAVDRNDVF